MIKIITVLTFDGRLQCLSSRVLTGDDFVAAVVFARPKRCLNIFVLPRDGVALDRFGFRESHFVFPISCSKVRCTSVLCCRLTDLTRVHLFEKLLRSGCAKPPRLLPRGGRRGFYRRHGDRQSRLFVAPDFTDVKARCIVSAVYTFVRCGAPCLCFPCESLCPQLALAR